MALRKPPPPGVEDGADRRAYLKGALFGRPAACIYASWSRSAET